MSIRAEAQKLCDKGRRKKSYTKFFVGDQPCRDCIDKARKKLGLPKPKKAAELREDAIKLRSRLEEMIGWAEYHLDSCPFGPPCARCMAVKDARKILEETK